MSAMLTLATPRIVCEPGSDGDVVLRSLQPLAAYERNVADMLRRWAVEAPSRIFMTEREPDGGRREITYGAASGRARAIAQALLDRGLGQADAIMVLSGNSVDHGLLMLGAYMAGVPIVPVSPAYSLLSQDLGKLRHIAGLVRPRLVLVADQKPFAAALALPALHGAEVVASRGTTEHAGATPFAELASTVPTAAVEERCRSLGPDAVAKVLFTSGSTDLPKGVLNTHRMLCSNQQALAQIWPFCAQTPPVLVDWLPWHHTFGANHNFNLVLKHGGTLHIDEGKPLPGLIDATIANLRQLSPTICFNVPAGFAQLLSHLERDGELRATFLRRLALICYAGASLSQDLWDRLEAVASMQTGAPVAMTSSWGMTETAPLATAAHFRADRAGLIGVPVPGVEIKLAAAEGGKTEMRVRGPNVTQGYLGLTAPDVDADGFLRTGDAGRLVDPADPNLGLVFDGRLVEDFKLSSGTFVSVGKLRTAALYACESLLQDVVVCGHDRDEVGLLGWPHLGRARELLGRDDATLPELASSPLLLETLRDRLRRHNAAQTGSSRRVMRLLLLDTPPSLDAGEITDKGYVNQRAALRHRQAAVERLYAEPADASVAVCAGAENTATGARRA